nr:hypothetical protein [Tanacetum cinerariifolium]
MKYLYSKSVLSVIKAQFYQFIHSKVLEPFNYNLYDLETRRDFKDYTQMEAQTFKETIIQNKDSIEKCIVERARHEQEIQNRLKRLNERKLQIVECKVQKHFWDDVDIKPSYDTETMVEVPYTAEHNVFAVETQHFEQPENMNDTSLMEKVDSNTTPDSLDRCDNDNQADPNVKACDDEYVTFANLIANLKLHIDENKKIQKQLKKVNSSLTQELKE